MGRYIATRLALALGSLIVASFLIFAAVELLPGDAASAALGREATPEALDAMRLRLGFDRSPLLRYWDWIAGIAHGDLGSSLVSGQPIDEILLPRMRDSGILLGVTLAVLVPGAIFLGTLAALHVGSAIDSVIQIVTLSLGALPEFVLGLMLIIPFAIMWPLFPAVSFDVSPRSIVLPAATLILLAMAYTARFVRAGVVEILESDYVAMARLKGLSNRRVLLRHVLPNALGPFAHALSITVAWLSGGVIIVEVLFAYPGLGPGLVNAISARDAPQIEALTLVLAAIYILSNLAADVFSMATTPRLRSRL